MARSTQRASYLASMEKSMHPEDHKNGDEEFELIDAPDTTKFTWLISGEILQQHESDAVVSTPKGNIHGDAFVTNYRLKFVPHEGTVDKDNFQFDFPLGLINSIKKTGYSSNLDPRDNTYGIRIVCKDLRNLKFLHKKEKHNRRAFFDSLVLNAFPNTNNKPFFAELYRQPFQTNGWNLFDPVKEFERMGIPNDRWSLTNMNEDYGFISTYPKVLVFPKEALDRGREFLDKVAKFRSSERIPALSWYDSKTNVAILRSSQPNRGIIFSSCSEDKAFLEMVWKANPGSQNVKIFDARPYGNAQANRLRGGGYETSYPHCKLIFLNIHSIHAMRKSLRAFKRICYPKKTLIQQFNPLHTVPQPLFKSDKSDWVSHLQKILNGTYKIVTEICEQRSSCLIHCSDGWDRTSQLASLVMLLLDSHYRTLEGFAILIEKEWLSFGHKFAIRFGHGIDDPKSEDRSPIFIQWVDCVWQYYNEFPTAFEFDLELLKLLLDEVYSCRFGTFLHNNEYQREDAKLKETTTSIWSYVLDNRKLYTNPKFAHVDGPLRTAEALKVKIWADYYCKHTWEALQNDAEEEDESPSSSEKSFQQIQISPSRPAPPPPKRFEKVQQETTKF